ncbi:MAG: DUF134 domain-containing protein [Clostridia bacterium]|nr:DUF134 domain-containing protein [Clostridia bacterium]NCC77488.1 DUF134 domain-containing protein [Clostridia bacterium]
MGRPIKWRRVSQMPEVLEFRPVGATGSGIQDNILLIEELEAIRLKDFEGLEQEACADQMQVSRPTFQRILMNARQKIADSLIHGKGIRIEGGTFTRNACPVHCLSCGKIWVESIEVLRQEKSHYFCPDCGSDRIVCAPDFEQGGPHRHGPGPGQGQGPGCRSNCWRKALNERLTQEESEVQDHASNHHSDG